MNTSRLRLRRQSIRRRRLAAALWVTMGTGVTTIAMTSNVSAQQWAFPTTGTWSDGTKWVGGMNPNSDTANAEIITTGGDYVVTLNTDQSVLTLTVGSANATLEHTSGILSVAGGITVTDGKYVLNNGTIQGGTFATSGSGQLEIVAGVFDGVALTGDLVLDQFNTSLTMTGDSSFTGDANISN